MDNSRELKVMFRKLFLAIFPEFNGYHYPIRAKVLKVHETAGTINDANHYYSVDVQPLKPDGSVDAETPVIPDVEIPVIWAGANRGIFCLPVVGAIVRVAYYYNDPAHPFVDAVLGNGFACPAHEVGSLIIQHSDGKRFEITTSGVTKITMDTVINGAVTINGQVAITGDTSITGATAVNGDISTDGSITASGTIMDTGGNSNHHKH
jgi:phage baseplate assembly protein gpV